MLMKKCDGNWNMEVVLAQMEHRTEIENGMKKTYQLVTITTLDSDCLIARAR